MPEALAADGRRLLSASTVAQLCDGHAIAEQCIAIVASGQRASIKDGPLADFIAIQDDGGDSGRRPRGLDDKRGGGRGGGNDRRSARSAGRGTGGKGSGNDKLKGCSTTAPRGPTCKFNHPPPCYRDPDWPGPISQAIIDNKPRLASLLADREEQAMRLNKEGHRTTSKALPLKGPNGTEETIAVLDDLDNAQFDGCNDCDGFDLEQAQDLNDILEVSSEQPGRDFPGIHMPTRLQQLRGIWVKSGSAVDQKTFIDAHAGWVGELNAKMIADRAAAQVVAVLDDTPQVERAVPVVVSLSVPFVQHDAARMAGAVMDPASGLWHAPADADLAPLAQWLTHAMPVRPAAEMPTDAGTEALKEALRQNQLMQIQMAQLQERISGKGLTDAISSSESRNAGVPPITPVAPASQINVAEPRSPDDAVAAVDGAQVPLAAALPRCRR